MLIYDKVKDAFEKSVKKDHLMYVKTKTRFCKFILPTDTMILGDYVVFYHWIETPQIIIIKNKQIANNYKEFFDQLWKLSKS